MGGGRRRLATCNTSRYIHTSIYYEPLYSCTALICLWYTSTIFAVVQEKYILVGIF